ncbi:MAG: DUF3800 domain-containing protein [Methanocalculus sp.]|uniref:DUF3800 domain-containing protein n=1 Tax=Methanocalculus sp. TaxID=2004547 RepID=UPI00271E7296|nr:DUF3800 domain-containing protein [Methanocalculus sp.]MDO8840809.1 DUF3800 domain-containing protein [Methanocalculus sp.]MDO9539337.1 DUF3800 domain-containing protein [Methanocalculus sp.]
MEIYIDESGDLGFGPQASAYFILAAIIIRDDQKMRRCFKKIRQNKLKKSLRDVPEFKFNNTKGVIKRRIMECISESDLDIAYALLRKSQVKPQLKGKQQAIYNYISGHLVSSIARKYDHDSLMEIYIDKSTYSFEREVLDQYLSYRLLDNGDQSVPSSDNIIIKHVDSRNEPCIQAADFVAGATHQMYRDNTLEHYNIIERKVLIALDFFNETQK